jgi:hypothetical protein
MSNGKPCEAHNMPRDICARCVGAAQEQDRIVADINAYFESLAQPAYSIERTTLIGIIRGWNK